MKKILFTLAAVLSLGAAEAQITVGQWDVVSPGESVTQNSDTMPGIAFPVAGADMTWDMTALNNHNQTVLNFGAATWFNNYALFPNANMGANDGSGFEMFFAKDASSFTMQGLAGDFFGTGVRTMTMNPAEEIIRFPSNFNDNYSTDAVQTFSFLGSDVGVAVDSIVNKRYTTKDVTIDGWGSLSTPFGTFDALRFDEVSNFADSTWIYMFGTGQLVQDTVGVEYGVTFWSNDPSTGFPLAELSHDNAGTIYSAEWLNSSPSAGLEPLAVVKTVSVFPNPAINEINIEFTNGDQSISKVDIYSLNGQLVKSVTSPSTTKIDIHGLETGAYQIHVFTNESEEVLRFIKE